MRLLTAWTFCALTCLAHGSSSVREDLTVDEVKRLQDFVRSKSFYSCMIKIKTAENQMKDHSTQIIFDRFLYCAEKELKRKAKSDNSVNFSPEAVAKTKQELSDILKKAMPQFERFFESLKYSFPSN